MLTPNSVSVPLPSFSSVPLPDMTLPKVCASERLKTSAALSTMSPVSEPVVPPSPTCKVPAKIVVPPAKVSAPVSVSVPTPDLVSAPPVRFWLTVKLFAASAISNPPPPAPQVMVRAVALNVVPVTCKAPPLKVRPPAASPRSASDDTLIAPPAKVVPPA